MFCSSLVLHKVPLFHLFQYCSLFLSNSPCIKSHTLCFQGFSKVSASKHPGMMSEHNTPTFLFRDCVVGMVSVGTLTKVHKFDCVQNNCQLEACSKQSPKKKQVDCYMSLIHNQNYGLLLMNQLKQQWIVNEFSLFCKIFLIWPITSICNSEKDFTKK